MMDKTTTIVDVRQVISYSGQMSNSRVLSLGRRWSRWSDGRSAQILGHGIHAIRNHADGDIDGEFARVIAAWQRGSSLGS